MKKNINIINLGEEFKEKKGIYNIHYKYNLDCFKGIYQCYNNPSSRKINIYNYYEELLRKNTDNFNILYYGIKTYNCNIITLHSIVEKDSKKYYLYITPTYNYYEEIKEEI